MSIRLAAGQALAPLQSSAALTRRMRRIFANDNGGATEADDMLHAALHHFGRHGLAAAKMALQEAATADAKGDAVAADYWRSICEMLDRRLARAEALKQKKCKQGT